MEPLERWRQILHYLYRPLVPRQRRRLDLCNNDDGGEIEQDFHDQNYRRILRNSFLVETAYAWQWKFGPLSEATIGYVGLHYDPVTRTNRSGMDDLVMDESGGTVMMIVEDWLDKHVTEPFEAHGHSRASVDILRMFLGLSETYANTLSFRRIPKLGSSSDLRDARPPHNRSRRSWAGSMIGL
jgi:hypothetical protein